MKYSFQKQNIRKSIFILALFLSHVCYAGYAIAKDSSFFSDFIERLTGTPSLIIAAKNGDVNKIKELIAQGEEVNVKDEYGYTPLMVAIYKGHKDVVIELINAGANLNIKTERIVQNTQAPTPEYTPLSLAMQELEANRASKDAKEIVEILIKNKASIDATSFALASRLGDIGLLENMYRKRFGISTAEDAKISNIDNYNFWG